MKKIFSVICVRRKTSMISSMCNQTKSKKVFISRTQREWDAIENKLKEIGRNNLNSYIRGQISLLERQYADCPSCVCTSVGKRIQKPFTVQPTPFKTLDKVSLKTGIPVSTIIDRLIIDPLILSK